MLRILLFFMSFSITSTSWSNEVISDPETVKNIFNGKTVYGQHLRKKKPGYNVYFNPNGTFHRFNEQGKTNTGKWHIDNKARQCLEFAHKPGRVLCRAIMPAFVDGIYFRVRLKGDKRIKAVKFEDFREGDQVPK